MCSLHASVRGVSPIGTGAATLATRDIECYVWRRLQHKIVHSGHALSAVYQTLHTVSGEVSCA